MRAGSALRHGRLHPLLDERVQAGESFDVVMLASNALEQLIAAGKSEAVVVSLGPQGALLVTADEEARIVPPTVKRQSTVGAGDSMVAAITLKRALGAGWLEAARYGVAAGTAATMNQGTELCRRQDVERIYAWLCQQG